MVCRQQLSALGYSRETPADKSKFLLDMATQFQELTQQALSTEYAGDEIFDRCPELKIATLVRNRSELFGRVFEKYAHAYDFDLGVATTSVDDENAETRKVRREPQLIDLDDIIGDIDDEIDIPEKGKILEWLKALYHNSRGFELGTFQASILSNSMRKQAVKWEAIAIGYISDIIVMVHKFIVVLLEHVCSDKTVRAELMAVLMEKLAVQYRKAIDHVHFLLQVECTESPGTLNGYFNMALQDSRKARHDRSNPEGSEEGPGLIAQLQALLLSTDYNIQEIHDILKSYYHIARERFVDCTFKQAAGHYLVFGSDTPLRLFSPKLVSGLTETQLEDIAGEDANIKRRRMALMKQVEDLENGKKVLH